jgi:hypothetical protein
MELYLNIMFALFAATLMIISFLPVEDTIPAGETITAPYYAKMQYAGNMGLASVGLGKTYYKDKLTLDFNYGYLPKEVNGSRVHTLALKSAYQFREHQISVFNIRYYAGISLNYAITDNTYLSYPDYFPSDYYNSNAIHLNPFLGIRLNLPEKKDTSGAIGIYVELGTVDYKIWYALANKEVKTNDIWNLCFGITTTLSNNLLR